MKKVFITGGHFAPAKAVLSKLTGWKVFYVGRKCSMEGEKALALEYLELHDKNNITYLCLTTGRLQRKFLVNIGQSIWSLFKIPIGFTEALYWLVRYQPDVVLSFGGYVAVPVVVGAWLLGIPVATHEQTKTVGLANRIIRLFGAKVLETGNPLREEILKAKVQRTDLIYITGGNQGSHVINRAIFEIVPKLVKKYHVLHQTGDSSYGDFEKAPKIANYEARKFLTAEESAQVLAKAYIVVSRAGANTVEELAYLGKPAILVPIGWAREDEQEKNAETLAKVGLAEIVPEEQLSGKKLLETIEKITRNYDEYKAAAKMARELVHPEAAERIVAETAAMAEEKREKE